MYKLNIDQNINIKTNIRLIFTMLGILMMIGCGQEAQRTTITGMLALDGNSFKSENISAYNKSNRIIGTSTSNDNGSFILTIPSEEINTSQLIEAKGLSFSGQKIDGSLYAFVDKISQNQIIYINIPTTISQRITQIDKTKTIEQANTLVKNYLGLSPTTKFDSTYIKTTNQFNIRLFLNEAKNNGGLDQFISNISNSIIADPNLKNDGFKLNLLMSDGTTTDFSMSAVGNYIFQQAKDKGVSLLTGKLTDFAQQMLGGLFGFGGGQATDTKILEMVTKINDQLNEVLKKEDQIINMLKNSQYQQVNQLIENIRTMQIYFNQWLPEKEKGFNSQYLNNALTAYCYNIYANSQAYNKNLINDALIGKFPYSFSIIKDLSVKSINGRYYGSSNSYSFWSNIEPLESAQTFMDLMTLLWKLSGRTQNCNDPTPNYPTDTYSTANFIADTIGCDAASKLFSNPSACSSFEIIPTILKNNSDRMALYPKKLKKADLGSNYDYWIPEFVIDTQNGNALLFPKKWSININNENIVQYDLRNIPIGYPPNLPSTRYANFVEQDLSADTLTRNGWPAGKFLYGNLYLWNSPDFINSTKSKEYQQFNLNSESYNFSNTYPWFFITELNQLQDIIQNSSIIDNITGNNKPNNNYSTASFDWLTAWHVGGYPSNSISPPTYGYNHPYWGYGSYIPTDGPSFVYRQYKWFKDEGQWHYYPYICPYAAADDNAYPYCIIYGDSRNWYVPGNDTSLKNRLMSVIFIRPLSDIEKNNGYYFYK